jgi:hypothetical protein
LVCVEDEFWLLVSDSTLEVLSILETGCDVVEVVDVGTETPEILKSCSPLRPQATKHVMQRHKTIRIANIFFIIPSLYV